MLFINVYDIDGFFSINWDINVYCEAVFLVIFGLGFFMAVLVTKVSERRGVIWQCTFGSNFAIIGLSLAGTLGGGRAVVLGLLCLVIREAQVMYFGSTVFTLKTQGKLLYTTLNNLKAIASPFALLVLCGQAGLYFNGQWIIDCIGIYIQKK